MALSGKTGEFSLADLIVVKVRDSGDSLPTFVTGEPPEAPLPERGLRPRITFRLVVDETGSVVEFLEGQRIDASRVTVDSRGTSEPLASNAELAGRRSNRRVNVWIVPH